jgi:hypothetical protein
MTMIRTWARHLVAVLMAFIGGWLLMLMEVVGYTDPAAQEQVLTAVETVITFAVMAAVYVVVEKALKPLWRRFGERQVGETAPPQSL